MAHEVASLDYSWKRRLFGTTPGMARTDQPASKRQPYSSPVGAHTTREKSRRGCEVSRVGYRLVHHVWTNGRSVFYRCRTADTLYSTCQPPQGWCAIALAIHDGDGVTQRWRARRDWGSS